MISDFLQDTIQKLVDDGKFHFMTTGDSNVILTLRGVTNEQDNYVKHLGVHVDQNI